jgi:hypothetical protein
MQAADAEQALHDDMAATFLLHSMKCTTAEVLNEGWLGGVQAA